MARIIADCGAPEALPVGVAAQAGDAGLDGSSIRGRMKSMNRNMSTSDVLFPGLMVLLLAALCAGCEALALTAVGVGGGVTASHQMGGLAYRTFTEPLPRVRSAVTAALKRMAIKPGGTEKIEMGERILARAGDRSIEVELEALTPNTTRIRAVVRRDGGVVVDSATAVEIINQTERSFGQS
jgi:hypothetical protein